MKAKTDNMGRPPLDPFEPSVTLQIVAPPSVQRRAMVYAKAHRVTQSTALRSLVVQSLDRWESESPELLDELQSPTLKSPPPSPRAEHEESQSKQTPGAARHSKKTAIQKGEGLKP